MREVVNRLLENLKAKLRDMYGRRLKGTYLFGSRARGEADAESDMDVLIVLDRVDHYGSEVDRTSHIVSHLSLDSGISISRVFVSEAEWQSGESTFLANVRDEAIRV